MDNNKRNDEMGNKSIMKLLIKFSTPSIIAMLVNALYNVVDTIVIGRGVGTLGIAGLTIVLPIQMMVFAVAMTIGIGTASIVSRNLGSKDYEKAHKAAGNAMSSAMVLGILTTILGLLLMKPILMVFGATESILPYAEEYFRIILLGAPFLIFSVTCNNLVRAEGSPMFAMYSMLIGAVLNIVFDPIFVFVFDMGIGGAALATIISQLISFLFLLWYYISGKSILNIEKTHLYPDIRLIMEIITVGTASFVRQSAASILAVVINNSLRIYGGDLYIAIYGVINRVLMFVFMPMFGIIHGFQPIVGYNYGAKEYKRVKETLYLSTIITTIMSFFGFGLLQLFPGFIMNIFSEDVQLIKEGVPILRIVVLLIPVVGLQIVGAAYFQAIGKATPAIILALSRQLLFLIPLAIVLPLFFDLAGVWASFPIADALATIVTAVFVVREVKHLDLKTF